MGEATATAIATAATTKSCPFCGEEVHQNAIKCKHCGEFFDESRKPAPQVAVAAASQPTVQVVVQGQGSTYGHGSVISGHATPGYAPSGRKTKGQAALLAFFIGGLGAHKFYLGGWFWGLVYLATFWTFIPAGIACIEAICYLVMSDETFDKRYNSGTTTAFTW
jgi:TM2 domain-containing membrane protein YozV